ncbi:MAG: T9SS type A sorting domain-containing protein [Bacteroidetes bacterium]|nr:T9SS type A sorting domain-containing protein [Bacteroidota bacterium]
MNTLFSNQLNWVKFLLLFLISQSQAIQAAEQKPLLFMENKGQILDIKGKQRNDVKFTYCANGTKLFITEKGIFYQFMQVGENGKMELHKLEMNLVNSKRPSEIRKENKSEYYENYFLSGQAVSGVHGYSKLIFKNVYPKVDWVIYTKNNLVEYDFIVHPGANPNVIQLNYSHADKLELNETGELLVSTRLGQLVEGKPMCTILENNTAVASHFKLKNTTLSFQLDNYNSAQTLIIDPTLVWSRYVGGNLNEAITKVTDNMAFGYTSSLFGIATSGGYQTLLGGSKDAFYSYFDNSGTIVYSTYFGGLGDDEALSGQFVSDGALSKAVMVGSTNSAQGITPNGALSDTTLDGLSDGFIAVFNTNGTFQYSSYFGGNDVDYISDVKLSGAKNDWTQLLLCGVTSSTSGFSASNSYQGANDAFVAKVSLSGATLVNNGFVYYGGIDSELANTICLGKNNTYFLSGNTSSNSNIATAGAFDMTLGGIDDDYIACFNSDLTMKWASYYGGTPTVSNPTASEKTGGANNGAYCSIDTTGNIYLLGNTTSGGLATSGSYATSISGLEDWFLVKFDSLGNRVWASYFGGFLSDIATCISINTSNLIVVGGYSNSPFMDINGVGFVGANHNNNDIDAVVAEFTTNGQFQWSSPLGTSQGTETFNSVSLIGNNLIAGGSTNSAFGMAYNSSSTFSGNSDVLLARFNDRVILTLPISNTSICPGDSVMVPFNTIGNFPLGTIFRALLYTNFSTTNPEILGTTTASSGIIHGYIPLTVGASFSGNSIRVASNLPNNPPISSTTQTVGAIGALPNAHIQALTSTNICNGSTVVLKSPSNTNIVFRQWQQFKNSNWSSIPGANSISYTADSAGSYRVITTSVTGCDSISNSINVIVQPTPQASISASSQLFCIGDNLVLHANTGAGYTYQWFVNNQLISGALSDSLIVNASAVYKVMVTNSAGCSTESVGFAVTGFLKPPAFISANGSLEICNGQSITLSANSSAGVIYQWYRNDTLVQGATSQFYSANKTGNYFVKELNINNCDSTSNILHVEVYAYPQAQIVLSGSPYTCLSSTSSLSLSSTPDFTYVWLKNGNSTGITDTFFVASGTTSDTYSVLVTNHGICSDTSNSIQINPAPPLAQICYASVDSNSQYNLIYFEKPANTFIKRYVFLRETAGNLFTAVDSIDALAPGFFRDTVSNPNSQAWSYLLQSVDSCDHRSTMPVADKHTCLFLQTNYNLGAGITNLSWNPYEGVNVTGAYYVVLRANTPISQFDSIGFVSFTSPTIFSDNATDLYPTALYKIEMKWFSPCSPSQKLISGINSSKSNIKNRTNTVGINDSKIDFESQIILIPNPTNEQVAITFPIGIKIKTVSILDILGKEMIHLYEQDLIKNNYKLDLSEFSSGIYHMNIVGDNFTETKKLVVKK